MYDLPSLNIESFKKIYSLIDEIKSEEIRAGRGIKKAKTVLRTKLSQVAKLCKQARDEILHPGGAMNKYGVDEGTVAVDKVAQESCLPEQCPACGATCTRHGAVLLCPTCGSKPFEENPVKKETGE
jgi:rubrerythrin